MDTNTNNIYLFKALDAYPFALEEAIEALNYALSYDENNVQALCLMANLQADQLGDYEAAKHYFEAAVASKMELPRIYPDYVYTLIRNEDFKEAQKVLDYALLLKSADKALLNLLQGQLFEAKQCNKKALKAYKKGRKLGLNNHFITFAESQIERVKKKLPKKKKTKKKKKRKTTKRKVRKK
jgi:tetratricopeptide (TPR) repeat protein